VTKKYVRNPNTLCFICAKPIYRRPAEINKNNGRVFCGVACYGISSRKETPCVVCGKLILAGMNKKTCGRSCANTHRAGIKYKIGSPKDTVKSQQALKVRLLKDRCYIYQRCTYNKFEILQIHHKDRENNSLENLELVCPNCHCEEHFLGKTWLRSKI